MPKDIVHLPINYLLSYFFILNFTCKQELAFPACVNHFEFVT